MIIPSSLNTDHQLASTTSFSLVTIMCVVTGFIAVHRG